MADKITSLTPGKFTPLRNGVRSSRNPEAVDPTVELQQEAVKARLRQLEVQRDEIAQKPARRQEVVKLKKYIEQGEQLLKGEIPSDPKMTRKSVAEATRYWYDLMASVVNHSTPAADSRAHGGSPTEAEPKGRFLVGPLGIGEAETNYRAELDPTSPENARRIQELEARLEVAARRPQPDEQAVSKVYTEEPRLSAEEKLQQQYTLSKAAYRNLAHAVMRVEASKVPLTGEALKVFKDAEGILRRNAIIATDRKYMKELIAQIDVGASNNLSAVLDAAVVHALEARATAGESKKTEEPALTTDQSNNAVLPPKGSKAVVRVRRNKKIGVARSPREEIVGGEKAGTEFQEVLSSILDQVDEQQLEQLRRAAPYCGFAIPRLRDLMRASLDQAQASALARGLASVMGISDPTERAVRLYENINIAFYTMFDTVPFSPREHYIQALLGANIDSLAIRKLVYDINTPGNLVGRSAITWLLENDFLEEKVGQFVPTLELMKLGHFTEREKEEVRNRQTAERTARESKAVEYLRKIAKKKGYQTLGEGGKGTVWFPLAQETFSGALAALATGKSERELVAVAKEFGYIEQVTRNGRHVLDLTRKGLDAVYPAPAKPEVKSEARQAWPVMELRESPLTPEQVEEVINNVVAHLGKKGHQAEEYKQAEALIEKQEKDRGDYIKDHIENRREKRKSLVRRMRIAHYLANKSEGWEAFKEPKMRAALNYFVDIYDEHARIPKHQPKLETRQRVQEDGEHWRQVYDDAKLAEAHERVEWHKRLGELREILGVKAYEVFDYDPYNVLFEGVIAHANNTPEEWKQVISVATECAKKFSDKKERALNFLLTLHELSGVSLAISVGDAESGEQSNSEFVVNDLKQQAARLRETREPIEAAKRELRQKLNKAYGERTVADSVEDPAWVTQALNALSQYREDRNGVDIEKLMAQGLIQKVTVTPPKRWFSSFYTPQSYEGYKLVK